MTKELEIDGAYVTGIYIRTMCEDGEYRLKDMALLSDEQRAVFLVNIPDVIEARRWLSSLMGAIRRLAAQHSVLVRA